jgi:MFS family permease
VRQIRAVFHLHGPLSSRNFRLLLACDVISGTGSAVAFVAIPFAVLATGGSASDVGYVASAALLPMILSLLAGGVAGDRFPRHKVMMAANVLQAAAQGASAILLLTGQARVWELLALAAARGIGLGFYYPAAQGLLPRTVPAGQRAQANAISRTGRNSAGIGGAALGGVLVAAAGPGWGLAVDAATFAVAAALRAGMRFPAAQSTAARLESPLHRLAGVRCPALAVGHRAAVHCHDGDHQRNDQRFGATRVRSAAGRREQLGTDPGSLRLGSSAWRADHAQVPPEASAASDPWSLAILGR